jgi:putative endonuclease
VGRILSPPPSPAIAGFGGRSPPEERDGGIPMNYTVYILCCADEEMYTGCAENLDERLKRHNKGYVPATKNRRPVKLVAQIIFENKYKAYEFEKYLKSGSGRAFIKRHLF